MHTITVRNVHAALPEGLRLLDLYGQIKDSRAGKVLVAPWPVMTIYKQPCERVLFWETRDANPFFHLMEALWMLAGRNDVEWLVRFNKKMRDFSDNGRTFHGAYGHRWRKHFVWEDQPLPVDQLGLVVELLKRHPDSRRAVIQMWDCTQDLMVDEALCRDVPCNDLIFVWNDNGSLNMTVMCRSNDIIWGAYGANAVHFSILQEYLAAKLGWQVGKLYQLSNNYHAYLDVFEKNKSLIDEARDPHRMYQNNPYIAGEVKPYPLVTNPLTFDAELDVFMNDKGRIDLSQEFENQMLRYAVLMKNAYIVGKNWKQPDEGLELLHELPTDWDFSVAAWQWMNRWALRLHERGGK